MGYLYALVSAFCFGISNVYWKTAEQNNPFSRLVFFRGIITVLLYVSLWLLLRNYPLLDRKVIDISQISVTRFFLAISITLCCSFGLVFYLKSLKFTPVSITVPLSSVNVFYILTAVFIMQEDMKSVFLFSIPIAAIGVWCIQRGSKIMAKGLNLGVAYALLSSLCWGVTYALFKWILSWLGPLPLSILLESSVTFVSFIWYYIENRNTTDLFNSSAFKQFPDYLILSLLLFGGTLFYLMAATELNLLFLGLLGNITIVVSVFLGLFWKREQISSKQFFGIILIFFSLVMVAFFQR